jgi:hypothetical protein
MMGVISHLPYKALPQGQRSYKTMKYFSSLALSFLISQETRLLASFYFSYLCLQFNELLAETRIAPGGKTRLNDGR